MHFVCTPSKIKTVWILGVFSYLVNLTRGVTPTGLCDPNTDGRRNWTMPCQKEFNSLWLSLRFVSLPCFFWQTLAHKSIISLRPNRQKSLYSDCHHGGSDLVRRCGAALPVPGPCIICRYRQRSRLREKGHLLIARPSPCSHWPRRTIHLFILRQAPSQDWAERSFQELLKSVFELTKDLEPPRTRIVLDASFSVNAI